MRALRDEMAHEQLQEQRRDEPLDPRRQTDPVKRERDGDEVQARRHRPLEVIRRRDDSEGRHDDPATDDSEVDSVERATPKRPRDEGNVSEVREHERELVGGPGSRPVILLLGCVSRVANGTKCVFRRAHAGTDEPVPQAEGNDEACVVVAQQHLILNPTWLAPEWCRVEGCCHEPNWPEGHGEKVEDLLKYLGRVIK